MCGCRGSDNVFFAMSFTETIAKISLFTVVSTVNKEIFAMVSFLGDFTENNSFTKWHNHFAIY